MLTTKTTTFRGQRLRDIRLAKGLSQEELSALTGISSVQISRYESGSAEPSLKVAKGLAQKLGITLDYLLGIVDRPEERLASSDLTPDEMKLLAAYRSGNLFGLIQLLAQKRPNSEGEGSSRIAP